MNAFINCIYIASAFLNFYYLYNLSNMIRLKYWSIHGSRDVLPTNQTILGGEDSDSSFTWNNFPEMHMQIHQLQPHLIQMNYDNNTASIYKYVTNLHVVGPF